MRASHPQGIRPPIDQDPAKRRGDDSSPNRADKIDSILSERPPALLETDFPPPLPSSCVVTSAIQLSAASSTTAGGPEPVGLHLAGMVPMYEDEKEQIRTDVFGERRGASPAARLEEERLTALEHEVARIHPRERSSLTKAMSLNPLLTIASPHVKLMLRTGSGDDDFDPAAAARRLARYWSFREDMFGDRAFSPGSFADPTFAEYTRHFDRCLRAADDPKLDDGARDLAREYVRCVRLVKIKAMEKVIESAVEEDKAPILEARRVCPDVASSDEHKILFLECEDYVEVNATVRMMKYWAAKTKLFGPERLHKDITLNDVESCVFDSHAERFFTLMPGTDESGRSILWILGDELAGEGWTTEGVAQYLWCIMHTAVARESCRTNGLVVIINYRSHTREALDRISAVRHLCRTIILECVPVRVRAIHIFLRPSGWWKDLLLGFFSKAASWIDKRVVVHLETPEETRSVLEDKFGVGPDQILQDMGGDWIRESGSQGL